jgi:hypothetical protein
MHAYGGDVREYWEPREDDLFRKAIGVLATPDERVEQAGTA